jgi:hypothetical protein
VIGEDAWVPLKIIIPNEMNDELLEILNDDKLGFISLDEIVMEGLRKSIILYRGVREL